MTSRDDAVIEHKKLRNRCSTGWATWARIS